MKSINYAQPAPFVKPSRYMLGLAVLASLGVVADAQVAQFQLAEIVVTAQRRAQNIQDVPTAVTALSPEMMKTNRVQTVNDLPGLTLNGNLGYTHHR